MKKIRKYLYNRLEEPWILISRKGLLKDSSQQQPKTLDMQTISIVIKSLSKLLKDTSTGSRSYLNE